MFPRLKAFVVSALAVLLFAQVQALPADAEQITETVFEMGKDRKLYAQMLPAQPGRPTLLLLPGVNRNVLLEEASAQALAEKGFGLVSVGFSPQPLSLVHVDVNQKAYFETQKVDLKELAYEMEFVAKELRKRGIKQIIPVSLSYSGIVSPLMRGFDTVIDTVPMTSTAATNPEFERYRQNLKAGEIFNPIFGPGITRSLLDQEYRKGWQKQVDRMIQQFDLPQARRDQMIEGYMTLSRAAEGQQWGTQLILEQVRRVMVIAGDEKPSLLKSQLEAYRDLKTQRQPVHLVMILRSGHIIPADQPVAYAEMIDLIIKAGPSLNKGIIIHDPATNKTEFQTEKESEKTIIDLLKKLKDEKEPARVLPAA